MTISITGNGLLFPPARDGRGDWITGDGIEAINSSIKQIVGVRGAGADTQGELPWRTEFGSQVHRLLYADNTAAIEGIAQIFVVDALRRYEPRIDLREVSIERFEVAGLGRVGLRAHVAYTIRATKSPDRQQHQTTVDM